MKVVYIGDHPSGKTTFTHGGNSVTFEKDKPKEVPAWLPNRFRGHSDFRIVEEDPKPAKPVEPVKPPEPVKPVEPVVPGKP